MRKEYYITSRYSYIIFGNNGLYRLVKTKDYNENKYLVIKSIVIIAKDIKEARRIALNKYNIKGRIELIGE